MALLLIRGRNRWLLLRHFHDGSEENVVESHISDLAEKALREFLSFVRAKLLALA